MLVIHLILITTLCLSIASLADFNLERKLIGHPYSTHFFGEWYRVLTSGFIHADVSHLFFNLYSFSSFSPTVLPYLHWLGWRHFSNAIFLLLYIGGIVSASLVSYYRHRHSAHYYHLGASAGVVAVMTAAVLCDPNMQVDLFFIIPIPGVLFLPVYLAWSFLARNSGSTTGHLAHFVGGIYGLLFMACIRYRELLSFFEMLLLLLGRM